MNLTNEQREAIVEAALSAYHEYLSDPSNPKLRECFDKYITRAFAPKAQPKPGQIVRCKYQAAVSPDIREYSGSNIDLEGCEWWRVIVTADECLEVLNERYGTEHRGASYWSGYAHAADLIRRLIAEAPRSSE